MKGYILNTFFVLSGSVLGLFIGKKINNNVKDAVFNTLGILTLLIGIKMAISSQDVVALAFCVVLGTFLGTSINIEERITNVLNRLSSNYFNGKTNLEGFIVASTLFCVGSMTIIGSIKDGLYNDTLLIKTKSVMDGFAAIILTSKFGISVIFSALTVFIIQGAVTIFSQHLTTLASPKMMGFIDGIGGIIVIGIALNLLNLKHIKTLDMLPSLVFIVIYGLWLS